MKSTVRMIAKAQVRKIHTLVSVLEMPDVLYRRTLEEGFGVASSTMLTFVQARRLIMVLQEFQRTFRRGEEPYYEAHFSSLGFRPGMASPEQLQKIEAMWNRLYPSPFMEQEQAELRAFLSHRFKTADLRFLDSDTAGKVISALKAMTKRKLRSSKNAPGCSEEADTVNDTMIRGNCEIKHILNRSQRKFEHV
ncbi:MAG: regulatory protein GemA [Syntrophorhabdus aromaticivorans]|uniref:Regulatory protein GemA n=1 Tax=Syntrophorhabdus aromaticivorans TaxID=328301 RepID=A0A971S1K0_9BACT|nr:regulatory protein GemA [Syntrophorhabdus aromaticivorans]